jgi:hypothetical protein
VISLLRKIFFSSVIILAAPRLEAQQETKSGPFVSFHVGQFWAKSPEFVDTYGGNPSTVFEGSFGYHVTTRINTFARFVYQPSSRRSETRVVEALDPLQYSIRTRTTKNHMWLLNPGFEYQFLKTDPFICSAGLGGLIGKAVEETSGTVYVYGGREFVETEDFGVAGIVSSITVEAKISGTSLSILLGGQYRYAPPLSSIFTMDYSGTTVDLGIKCVL